MDGPVSEAEVRGIITKWGELHDRQVGLSAFLPLIARTGFYMEFAGKRWEGYEGFERHQITRFEYLAGFAAHDVDDDDPHLDPTHGRRR
jgi:hypothetical protein